jgi:hypothetical protein
MPDKPAHPDNVYDDGNFTSECCDLLEIREEDTKPGPKLTEQERQKLAQKYGRKIPPPNPPARQE